ncbi:membrane protein [Marinicella pacifica]|uniref:Membrane protein n=1 Tax=Marinicella pacifica TaxID=1171543 RepID=A0A917CEC3_9GAMM|nr:FtsX-like permease family protein [Marinicella pacifica]GGF85168.1 membrane protein [Marinicella pacifica]
MMGSLGRKMLNRAWFGQPVYPLLFGLSLWVSLAAYLTLDSLQQSVDDYIEHNQLAMVGGDLIMSARQPWPDDVQQKMAELPASDVVYDYQFNAMLYANEQSLLARIKAVTPSYPLYGEATVASGQALWQSVQPGQVAVEAQVLSGLNLSVGDRVQLGEASFIIADELTAEPDRPLTAFGFGARVLMHADDLPQTELMGQRSRVGYRIEMKLNPAQLIRWKNELTTLIGSREIKVQTAAESDTALANVSTNFLVFLKLLVVAVVVLSGVGLFSVMKAFIRSQQNSNAIRRALGEQMRPMKQTYYRLFIVMALLSALVAFALSYAFLIFSEDSFSQFLPADIDIYIAWQSVLKITVIAVAMTLLVSYQSLRLLARVKPVAVLQQQKIPRHRQTRAWGWFMIVVLAVLTLMVIELDSVWRALQLTGGLIAVLVIFWLLSLLLLKGLKWLVNHGWIRHWLSRLAIQNVFRKGNHSVLFFTTLSLAVMVMMIVALLNHSIDRQLISTYPEDAPNMFLLDVQTEQHEKLNDMINAPVTYYPVVRARIKTVNGVSADVLKDQLGTYDDIGRVFNLSYANELLDTEYLKAGHNNQLFTDWADDAVVPLSILASIAEYLQVDIGDDITFNIQGVYLTGRISSIRARYERGPNPFFYFIFPPEVLAKAPQIQFATTRVADERVVALQTQIAQTFPGITTLDGAAIARQVKSFVGQLSQLVTLFTGLAVIAGFMVLLTSLLSTSQDRLQDSAYFRLLGMRTRHLYAINVIEMSVLGLLAGFLGTLLAISVSYWMVTVWFNLQFSLPVTKVVIGGFILWFLLAAIALIYGRMVIGRRVMQRIRQMV